MKRNAYDLIISPITTEKTTRAAEQNQVVFRVKPDATKSEIKRVVEEFFSVKVRSVNTSILKGKTKRFKDRMGKQKDYKKAYVSLEDGHDINFAE